jgi:uncharacterized membrane protein
MPTKTGLSQNAAGLMCYLLGWLTGIIFLVLEPDNQFVRFHAIQSIIVFGVLSVLIWIFSLFIWGFSLFLALFGIFLWVILMVKAYHGERFRLPIAGDIANKNS